mmetsp:Transcript_15897/g.37541  ORF Transcript_15897/g.37541 Transcript_15897/m.37541 type:complete len:231 (-) Transcript_15897:378-1070(-)
MVAQNTEPGLVGEARSLIHTFEDLIELVLRRVRDLIHRTPTCLLDAAPVKVVPNVEDVLWVDESSAGFKGIGHQKLRLIIYACHIATLWGARSLAAGVEAFHELLVVAELHCVHLVPAAPGEDAGSRPASPLVSHNGLPALWWVQGTVHATPVTDGKDVHLLGAMDYRGWPVLTLVAQGGLGGNASNTFVVPIAARAMASVKLVACETVAARRIAAARAGRQAAEGVPWR